MKWYVKINEYKKWLHPTAFPFNSRIGYFKGNYFMAGTEKDKLEGVMGTLGIVNWKEMLQNSDRNYDIKVASKNFGE